MSNLSSSRPSFALSIYGQEEEINRLKKIFLQNESIRRKRTLKTN